MTEQEEKKVIVSVLLMIVEALNEGAAGPCDYWYKRLAERLLERAEATMKKKP